MEEIRNYKSIYKSKRAKLATLVATIATTIFVIFSALVFVANKTFDYAVVEGLSMYPTINATAKTTTINDYAYYSTNKRVARGDIIIVDYIDTGSDIDAIKRLIAIAGDTICYYNGNILLNGEVLTETYLENGYEYLKNNPNALKLSGYTTADDWKDDEYTAQKNRFESWCKKLVNGTMEEYEKRTEFFKNFSTNYSNCIRYDETIDGYVLTIPKNHIFFLGDNRLNSSDCNTFGPIENKYLKAKVCFVTTGQLPITVVITKKILHLFD